MKTKFFFPISLGALLLIVGGIFIFQNKTEKKQVTSLKPIEKKIGKDLGLSEKASTLPLYPGAVKDEDKCGKEAFFVKEKSADFVKNVCRFFEGKGWQLNHPDYSTCDEIKSFGGGYNYDKGQEKGAISVIKYGEDGTCYWVFKRSR